MNNRQIKLLWIPLVLVLGIQVLECGAAPKGYNYDEDKVPEYQLPDALLAEDGSRITRADQWTQQRRPEILELFEKHVYGRRPGRPENMEFEVTSIDEDALDGRAIRKEVTLHIEGRGGPYALRLLLYVPKGSMGSAPAFLGYNFNGNHSIHSDPGITLSPSWMRRNENGNIDNLATEAARGVSSQRWPVEKILDRGYALATAYYGDIEPDHRDGWKTGIRNYYKTDEKGEPLAVEDWSAISAWAWGLSRIMDYLETDPDISASKVALMGHSRLGKTALWAGAMDERFALTISNNSGCGGAALSRRAFGETVERINTSFPHWFCQQFKAYNSNESALPVDQHELIALMAPRPVYVASAEEDVWADPVGQFLSAREAGSVYELFHKQGVGVESHPDIHAPVGDFVGYHIRAGKHDVTDYDWDQYLNFAERHFTAAKPGIYALWYAGTPYADKVLDLPYIVGGQVVVQWGRIETAKGEFDFAYLDQQIKEVADSGLNFTIQFNGNNKPAWMFEEIPFHPEPLSHQVRDEQGSLMWWHGSYRDSYRKFLVAMGDHIAKSAYKDNIIGIRMNFNAFGTEHTHMGPEHIPLRQWVVPDGCDRSIPIEEWSREIREDYVAEVMHTFIDVFSGKIKVFVRNTIPADLEDEFRDDFRSGRLAWFHTSSEAEPRASGAEVKYGRFYDDARSGNTVAFAEPWASAWGHHGGKTDDRWCSPTQWNYWRLLIDLHCGISYIGVYASDLRVAADGQYGYGEQTNIYSDDQRGLYQQEFDAAYRFASKYVGYHDKPETSPGAWVAFRESNYTRAANDVPQKQRVLERFNGDYDFLMKRQDGKSYGQDVVNIGPDHQRYGAFARILPAGETMQLVLDEAFASSLEGKACAIKITYYDKEGKSFEVTGGGVKKNFACSGQDEWKTVTIHVSAASFLNEGEAHIQLEALEKDLTLHMVEVVRSDNAGSIRRLY